MPKIELQEQIFFQMLGRRPERTELAQLLTVAKGEIDEWDPQGGLLKIELNDTNRPDLWSAAGLSRQLRVYLDGRLPEYPFFSRPGKSEPAGERMIEVEAALKEIRPYIAAFVARGVPISEAQLLEVINSQEKLCWNFGRKRATIAMGVYRADLMKFPVRYRAADPDQTRFVPLDFSREMSLREILEKHPKGVEFGWIVKGFERFPYLEDARGNTLSFPPVINSAHLGAVRVGDANHFVELTGPDLDSLLLACSIVACDLADMGYEILPVKSLYPYDTPYGRELVTPFYFQKPVELEVVEAVRLLGEKISPEEAEALVRRMGNSVRRTGGRLTVEPPAYRNDFLHPVDAVEEIMIGRGMESFEPIWPEDFTVGRLTLIEQVSRRAREIMAGLGYQEMIYNYLGSRRDFVDRMQIPGDGVIEIANPMTESYAVVRNSQLPCLLLSESVSSNAAYPHRIFEIGKAAYLDERENYGSRTVTMLSLLAADSEAGFNEVKSHLSALFYYLHLEHSLAETEDPRFVPGRVGFVVCNGRRLGLIGEIHPAVLEAWGIQVPCAAAEIELEGLLEEAPDPKGR
jgi:phenylalanyl-tRNA synthetase beta chain